MKERQRRRPWSSYRGLPHPRARRPVGVRSGAAAHEAAMTAAAAPNRPPLHRSSFMMQVLPSAAISHLPSAMAAAASGCCRGPSSIQSPPGLLWGERKQHLTERRAFCVERQQHLNQGKAGCLALQQHLSSGGCGARRPTPVGTLVSGHLISLSYQHIDSKAAALAKSSNLPE